MQNYKASFPIRVLSILVINSLIAFNAAQAEELITFDGYPDGTTITDQYRSLGVIISGMPEAPNTVPPWDSETNNPAITGPEWDNSIIVEFINPSDGTPVEVLNCTFNWWVLFRYSSPSTWITYYDIDNGVIDKQEILNGNSIGCIDIPDKLHKVVLDPGHTTYVWMDNLSFQHVPTAPTQPDPGPSEEVESKAGEPINLTNGDVWIPKTDYSVPGLAGGLSAKRTWNSLWNHSSPPFEIGMFGRGWTSSFEERLQTFNSNHTIYWNGSGNIWVFKKPVGCTDCAYSVISPLNQHASIQYDASIGQRTLSFSDGTKKTFNYSGQLLAIIDRNGNQTTVSYDNSNRIAMVNAPGGQQISFTYNNLQNTNLATSILDTVGTVATFNYANSNLTQVIYADGSEINYGYDDANNIISMTDNEGKVLAIFTYDTSGRGLSSSHANSIDLVTIEYISDSSTVLTDSAGNKTTYQYSTISNKKYITAVEGPGCNSCGGRNDISFDLDESGNRLSRTDANGNTISYTYDHADNLITSTDADGTRIYTYNNFGQILSETNPQGNTTTYLYDNNGNLESVTEPSPDDGVTAGPNTQFQYDVAGQLVKILDPLGKRHYTAITYYPTGLISTIKNAQRKITAFNYDERGNRTSITDMLNQTTSFTYDAMNRLTDIVHPDDSTQQFAYDSRWRKISVTDANNLTTNYGYDDADRLISITDAAYNQTLYFYDNESNLTSVIDELNRTTSFDYNSLGHVTNIIFPSYLSETYSYDNVGNLTDRTDRNGQCTTYKYDQLNRMTEKRYTDYTATYNYNNMSKLTEVNDPTGMYRFVYDNLGRMKQAITDYSLLTNKSFTVSYGYDVASNLISLTDPENNTTTYNYNTLNQLTSLTAPGRKVFKLEYDALGRRTKLSRPNAIATNYTYDLLSRLLSMSHTKHNKVVHGVTYTVGAAGNHTSRISLLSNITKDYTYDDIYQLVNVVQKPSVIEKYSYDEIGNRMSSINSSPYTYNSSNELISIPGIEYSYDNNGNLLEENSGVGTTNYIWDNENRLTSTTIPESGETVIFQYDPFGRRIYKSSSLGTTIFIYDGDNIIEEVNTDGSLMVNYIHYLGTDEPLAILHGATISYYQADGLGSITSLSDSKGNLVSTYEYDSFGNLLASTGSVSNPFRFTGREFDAETGLYFYRARYYDPSIGRFISEDPIRSSWSAYTYVRNNPVNYVDPTGEFLVAGPILVAVVYGPAIMVTAYRFAPYFPIAGDFLSGLILPGTPPPSVAGKAGSITRVAIDAALEEAGEKKRGPTREERLRNRPKPSNQEGHNDKHLKNS